MIIAKLNGKVSGLHTPDAFGDPNVYLDCRVHGTFSPPCSLSIPINDIAAIGIGPKITLQQLRKAEVIVTVKLLNYE